MRQRWSRAYLFQTVGQILIDEEMLSVVTPNSRGCVQPDQSSPVAFPARKTLGIFHILAYRIQELAFGGLKESTLERMCIS